MDDPVDLNELVFAVVAEDWDGVRAFIEDNVRLPAKRDTYLMVLYLARNCLVQDPTSCALRYCLDVALQLGCKDVVAAASATRPDVVPAGLAQQCAQYCDEIAAWCQRYLDPDGPPASARPPAPRPPHQFAPPEWHASPAASELAGEPASW